MVTFLSKCSQVFVEREMLPVSTSGFIESMTLWGSAWQFHSTTHSLIVFSHRRGGKKYLYNIKARIFIFSFTVYKYFPTYSFLLSATLLSALISPRQKQTQAVTQ